MHSVYVSVSSMFLEFLQTGHTRSVGFIEVKLRSPEMGLFSSQSFAHWLLCVEIASSSALL